MKEYDDAPKEPEPIFLPSLYFPPTRRSRRCEDESAIDGGFVLGWILGWMCISEEGREGGREEEEGWRRGLRGKDRCKRGRGGLKSEESLGRRCTASAQPPTHKTAQRGRFCGRKDVQGSLRAVAWLAGGEAKGCGNLEAGKGEATGIDGREMERKGVLTERGKGVGGSEEKEEEVVEEMGKIYGEERGDGVQGQEKEQRRQRSAGGGLSPWEGAGGR